MPRKCRFNPRAAPLTKAMFSGALLQNSSGVRFNQAGKARARDHKGPIRVTWQKGEPCRMVYTLTMLSSVLCYENLTLGSGGSRDEFGRAMRQRRPVASLKNIARDEQ